MNQQDKLKVLVAVDGTGRCLKTIHYLRAVRSLRKMHVVLFNVFSSVPDAYWDLEKEPASVKMVSHVRAWEATQRQAMQNYLEKCKRILMEAGFEPSAIEKRIHHRVKGVARDILEEVRKGGYEAVVLRRRGAAKIRQLIMGSVATKLVEGLSFLPVIIAGQLTVGNRLLIGVDGSTGSMRAVAFAGRMMAGSDAHFRLVRVIRDSIADDSEDTATDPDLLEEIRRDVDTVFEKATEILTGHGHERGRIETHLITGTTSRAASLAREAEEHHCDTIVVGRRGLSRVEDFFIGRVSNKVIQVARKHTIWVVT